MQLERTTDHQQLLNELRAWCEAGWLRHVDVAFAEFIHRLLPSAPSSLLLASALLVQVEGQGHTCLGLSDLIERPEQILSNRGADALAALRPHLPSSAEVWLKQWQHSEVLGVIGVAALGGQPLVLWPAGDQARLYLRRYWSYELGIASAMSSRATAASVAEPQDLGASAARIKQVFPATVGNAEADWQKIAAALAMRGAVTLITGGPGTGKTYTAARLIALLFAQAANPKALRIALAAPTGKAAARLRQSIQSALQDLQAQLGLAKDAPDLQTLVSTMGAALTLHALLGARPDTRSLRHTAQNPLAVDVLIVDEASMIHAEMMVNLLRALPATARLILLGDKDQLASVEAGSVLADLCASANRGSYRPETARYLARSSGQKLPAWALAAADEPITPLAQQTVMLRRSMRFQGPIGALAVASNLGDYAAGQQVFAGDASRKVLLRGSPTPEPISQMAVAGRDAAPGGYSVYLDCIRNGPKAHPSHADWVHAVLAGFDRFRVLSALRAGEWGAQGINQAIQSALQAAGRLPKNLPEWYVGRPVMVTRNDHSLGVFNGDVGVVLPAATGSGLKAWFADGSHLRAVAVHRLAHIETAFAMTVHKSQGSEFAHCLVVLPPGASGIASRELLYTGITRAKTHLTLITPQREALELALATRTLRGSGLRQLLLGP